jgi:hypothetical protein
MGKEIAYLLASFALVSSCYSYHPSLQSPLDYGVKLL